MIRNVHGISLATGVGFLFVFKAWQRAHSKLCNCCHNAEDGQKDKRVVEVISSTFLSICKTLSEVIRGTFNTAARRPGTAGLLFVLLFLQCKSLTGAETPGVVIINTDTQVKKYQMIQQAFESNFAGTKVTFNLADEQQSTDDIENTLQLSHQQVVYAIGAQAYLSAHRIAKQHKIIFSSTINWQRLPMAENVYGIANELPPQMQLTLYRYLFPKLKTIGVIYSADYNREWLSGAEAASKDVGIEIISEAISKPSELKDALSEILSVVDVLWLISDPVVLSSTEATKLIFKLSDALKKPVFTYHKVFNQFGALLVISADIPTMGQQVADLARKLLTNNAVQPHVINPAGSHISLNMKKLHEYRLDLNYDALDSVNEIIE